MRFGVLDDTVQHIYVVLHEPWPLVRDPGRYALGCALKAYVSAQVRELQRRGGNVVDVGADPEPAAPGSSMEDLLIERHIDRPAVRGAADLARYPAPGG